MENLNAMKTLLKVDPAITFDHMHSEPDEIDQNKIREYQKLSWIMVGIEMVCIAMLLGFMLILF